MVLVDKHGRHCPVPFDMADLHDCGHANHKTIWHNNVPNWPHRHYPEALLDDKEGTIVNHLYL